MAREEARVRIGESITYRTPDPAQTIGRPRLERLLRSATSRRLVTLTAGPGYGKTTLLAQLFGQGKAAWHTATPLDTSLPTFVLNVIERTRLLVPALTADLRTAAGGPTGPEVGDDGRRVEALAAAVAHELEQRLTRDLVLVIDDVHELGPDGDSIRFLGALCRNAPPILHIVTASRQPLPFPTSRLHASGEVQEITANDLSFDETELSSLVAAILGVEPAVEAAELLRRTGGWPVAVNMMLRTMSQVGRLTVDEVPGTLFDYLAEELFAQESVATLEALASAVDLPWVNPDLLKVLGIHPDTLSFDPSNPCFTQRPDTPHAWSVSPLIAEYLRRRVPWAADTRQHALATAARWYLDNDHLAEALACHRVIGASADLVELLEERGSDLLAAGMARHVLPLVETLGEPEKSMDILLLEAEARQILGDWEGAMTVYRRLEPDGPSMSPRLAWRLGFLQHMRGDVAGALETYRRGELGTGDATNEAALLGWMASAYWLRGERDQAKLLADQSLALAVQAGASQALATAHTVLAMVAALDGDRATNDIHYLRALEHAENAGDVLQTIRIRSNRGSHFLEEGDFAPALEEIEIALRLADMTGFELWRAMALSNRAQITAFLGQLDEAINDLRGARAIFRSIGSSLEAYPTAHLGHVYSLRGDTAMARASFEEAIRIADEQSDLQALVPALSGLARLIASENTDEAERLAQRAASAHSVIGRAGALVALGEVVLARGDPRGASEHAVAAAELARERNDLPELAESLELAARTTSTAEDGVRLLEEARRVWIDIGAPIGASRVDILIAERTGGPVGLAMATAAAETLGRLGAKGLALWARRVADTLSESEPRAVVIGTLGGFEVLVEGDPVPSSAWQSRVARDLLGMLIAARGRPIHREVLMERLWPDEDPKKASNRLSVALTTIRRVLDPHKRHDSARYLSTDHDAVALSSTEVSVDVESFLAKVAQGRALLRDARTDQGMALLAAAEETYVGDFLEGNPYADWAIALREEARTAYVEAATVLAEHERRLGDHDSAARRYLRILEREPYHEGAHLGLVEVMVASGRRGSARRLYSSYVSRMAELDVEPRPFPS